MYVWLAETGERTKTSGRAIGVSLTIFSPDSKYFGGVRAGQVGAIKIED
jgi:hypothetical protein